MDDAAGAVATFAGQVVAGFVLGEGNALFDQPFDGAAAVFDDEAGGRFVVEPGARNQGVLDVGFDRVLAVENRGNASLGPA